VLEIQIPKPEQRKPRKVTISAAEADADPKRIARPAAPASSETIAGDPVTAAS
jgi:hypothetical protein